MRRVARRLAGWLWILGWFALLYAVVSPWQELGGLVSERWRWLEWFVLGAGLVLGCQVGAIGRRAARPGTGRSHIGLLRWVLWPPAATAAAGLVLFRVLENAEAIGVVATGFLAYWAGLDTGLAAWPLVRGERHRFTGAILPASDPPAGRDDERVPPRWMGS